MLRTPLPWAVGLTVVWLGSVVVQAMLPLSTAWALLDGIRHGCAATWCVIGLLPRAGWRPIVLAGLVGVFIDLDHAVAAWSLAPSAMMGLGVRPITHSLFVGLVLGVVAWPVLGGLSGYAMAVGLAAHVLEDATEWPGVPLLFPVWQERHALLSDAVAFAALLAFALFSWWLGGALRGWRQRN